MAVNIGTAQITLEFDGKELKGELKQVDQQLQHIGKSSSLGGKLADGTVSSMKKLAKTAAATATAMTGAVAGLITKGGFDRAMNIEQASFKLQGLGHDAQSVQGIMDNALASVKGTAYGLGEAASVAASTVAAGVKPGQDLERTLKLVGDAAAISGREYNEMGAIFNKVAAAGKMTGEELNQLTDSGIPILQLLGDTMGKSTEEVRKLVSEGKIGFAEFQDAIEKGMGGAALTMGQTFSGAVANTQAALSRLGVNIMQPLMDGLTPALGTLISIIDDIGAGTTEEVEAKTNQLITQLTTTIQGFIDGLGPLLDNIIPVVMKVVSAITKQLPSLVKSILPVLLKAFTEIINGLVDTIPDLIDTVIAAIDPIIEALAGIGDKLIQALPDIIKAVTKLVIALAKALTNPTNLQLLLKGFLQLLLSLQQAVYEAIPMLLEALPDIIVGLVEFLTNPENWGMIFNAAVQMFMNIVNAIPQVLTALGNAWNEMKQRIGAILVELFTLIGNWGSQVWNKATEIGSNFLNSIVSFFAQLPGNILNFLGSVISGVAGWVANMIGMAVQAGVNFVAGIVDNIARLPGRVWQFLSSTIGRIASFMSQAVTKAKQGAKNIFDSIVNTLKELPSKVLNIGKDLIKGLWEGIGNMAGWIGEKIKGFGEGILNQLKDFFGIHSPSTLMRDTIGINLAKGVGVGFEDGMKAVSSEIESSLPTVEASYSTTGTTSWMNDISQDYGQTASAVGGGVHIENQIFEIKNDADARDIGRRIEREMRLEAI